MKFSQTKRPNKYGGSIDPSILKSIFEFLKPALSAGLAQGVNLLGEALGRKLSKKGSGVSSITAGEIRDLISRVKKYRKGAGDLQTNTGAGDLQITGYKKKK